MLLSSFYLADCSSVNCHRFLFNWFIIIFFCLHCNLVIGEGREEEEKVFCNHSNSIESSCTRKPNWRWYSTKTKYQDVLDLLTHQAATKDTNLNLPDTCVPRSLFLISRHATRYPDHKIIKKMREQLPALRDRLLLNENQLRQAGFTDDDLSQLANWKLEMRDQDDNRIADYGRKEAQSLGKRFLANFEPMFDPKTSNISIGITFKQRTRDTAKEFLKTFQEKNPDFEFNPTVKTSLISHRECKKALERQGVLLRKPEEHIHFISGNTFQLVLKNLALKLNESFEDSKYDKESSIATEFKLIYSACIYEQAIFGHSIWCHLFTPEEMRIIEYSNDLNIYYAGSYGRDINKKITCDLLNEILQQIHQSVSGPQPKKYTSLNFTHAGLLKRLYAMLGLFEKFSSSHCRSTDHCWNEWRTSLIVPFLSNLNLIVYDCPTLVPSKRIVARVQEYPVLMKGCEDLLCSLDEFIATYAPLTESCDLEKICRL